MSLFSSIEHPKACFYNAIFRLHVLLSSPAQALLLFRRMRRQSVAPDIYSFPFLVKAVSSFRWPEASLIQGLHGQVIRFGFLKDLYVGNTLIRGYCVCGDTDDGYKVFDEILVRDLVSYNSMIDGLVKSGELILARELFDRMHIRNSITWATLMSGYSQNNQYTEAIELFDAMMASNVKPENVALVSALSSCARLGKAQKGKEIHDYIERNAIKIDVFLSTGLVDFYAKCGFIDAAVDVFESCSDKGLNTWNALIHGLAMHGLGKPALNCFSRMMAAGIHPDGVTLLSVLVGCSHCGLVNEAKRIFNEMESVYGVAVEAKHYGCMVDLLGRAGLIEEAMEMTRGRGETDAFVWCSVLAGCRSHGNGEVAERAARMVMELKPGDCGAYSVLANVYADMERWDDVADVRRSLSSQERIIKKSACSFLLLNGVLHPFLSSDKFHPRKDEIFTLINTLSEHQLEVS